MTCNGFLSSKKTSDNVETVIKSFKGCDHRIQKMNDNKADSKSKVIEAVIHDGPDEVIKIIGYINVFWRQMMMWFFVLLTGGLGYLFMYWKPQWKLKFTHKKECLSIADTVLIEDMFLEYKNIYVKPIICQKAPEEEEGDNGSPKKGSKKEIPFLIPSPKGTEMTRHEVFRFFRCRKHIYVWDYETEMFFVLHGLDTEIPLEFFHSQNALTTEQKHNGQRIYGTNDIIVPDRSIPYLLVKEVLNPFYVFQLFSVILWFTDEYNYYASAIVIMSVLGVISAVYQTKQNQSILRSTVQSTDIVLVAHKIGDEIVYRNESSSCLVPGDVVVIPKHGCQMLFDAVLIAGSVIVNEAMLTGESVPIMKFTLPKPSYPGMLFNSKVHSLNTLFCGTRVIQAKHHGGQNVLAVVVRTGFSTLKGNLVRSIMYPQVVDFKFELDSYIFLGVLAALAAIGFTYTCIKKVFDGLTAYEITIDALDLITIVIPPALPAAMTIGSIYAQKRLRKKNIFCISPRTINVVGSIDCVCFDKTGTLTEDGLDLWGLVGTKKVTETGGSVSVFTQPIKDPSSLDHKNQIIHAMASCHALSVIDGKLVGDPLDLIMFGATKWLYGDPSEDLGHMNDSLSPSVVYPAPKPTTSNKPRTKCTLITKDVKLQQELLNLSESYRPQLGIVRQFPFTSSRRRMTVATRELKSKNFVLYTKGSPEKIVSLSRPETVPKDFNTVLESYTQHGYRVIAIARRSMPQTVNYVKLQRMEHHEAEKDLEFLGLLILENRLKIETKPIIQELQKANLRTIMITGDNLLTALSVANECDIISPGNTIIVEAVEDTKGKSLPEFSFTALDKGKVTNYIEDALAINVTSYNFAISGQYFDIIRHNYPDLLDRILTKGAVFARMNPDQKQILIELLQKIGYYVAMCGDGANDCGALKMAHAGISLSESESSVASPFTSSVQNISCVPQLIREGRCALVTSFGIFKYMAAYSITQFISIIFLYSIGSNLSDIQFLYIDLFLITVIVFFFGMTEAFEGELYKVPPMKSLISFAPLCSLILQILIITVFQIMGFFHVRHQDWFAPFNQSDTTYSLADNQTKKYYETSPLEESRFACWENYSIFSVSVFQYIILAFVFSKAFPYRKPIYSNKGLLFAFIFLTCFTTYIVLYPSNYLQNSFELLMPPDWTFRIEILGLVVTNMLVCFFFESIVVEILIIKYVKKWWYKNRKKSKRRYLSIDQELSKLSTEGLWPPLSKSTTPIRQRYENFSFENNSDQKCSEAIKSLAIDTFKIINEKAAFDGFAGTETSPSKESEPFPRNNKVVKLTSSCVNLAKKSKNMLTRSSTLNTIPLQLITSTPSLTESSLLNITSEAKAIETLSGTSYPGSEALSPVSPLSKTSGTWPPPR